MARCYGCFTDNCGYRKSCSCECHAEPTKGAEMKETKKPTPTATKAKAGYRRVMQRVPSGYEARQVGLFPEIHNEDTCGWKPAEDGDDILDPGFWCVLSSSGTVVHLSDKDFREQFEFPPEAGNR